MNKNPLCRTCMAGDRNVNRDLHDGDVALKGLSLGRVKVGFRISSR